MLFDEFLIKSLLPVVENWPKPGFRFRDITPLFRNPKAARMVTDAFVHRYVDSAITHIGAVDARGFLLGSNLAYALNKPLILFRKENKLPGPVDSIEYQSDYASGVLQLQKDSLSQGNQLLLVDDVIASGHTLFAASELAMHQGAEIVEAAVIVDLVDMGGSERLRSANIPVYSLLGF